jgi:integrase
MAKAKTAARLHVLTARELMAAADGDHGDGGGLLLRVRGESVSWVFRYTSPAGRRREMGLGPVQRGNPKQAGESLRTGRELAHDARELLRRGADPIDERDRAREANRDAETAAKLAAAEAAEATKAAHAVAEAARARTLARVARAYHERVIEPKLTAKHAAQWISSLENHVPAEVWHAPVHEITPPALLAALAAIKPHDRARNVKGPAVPETLRRIRQRLDCVFEDAIFHGLATTNPAAAILRKLREETPARSVGKLAALPYAAAPAFCSRLRTWPGTAARCLEFAMLTAARTGEAIGAEWSEIDLDGALWVVPADRMKADEAHTVFLSQRAVQLLRGQVGQHARLVFPSSNKRDAALSNMAMLTLLTRMGVRQQTTVHGLCRATFSTWANETGAGRPDVIEACLAHSEGDRVRASYNRAQFNHERRALLLAWAEYLANPQAQLRAA